MSDALAQILAVILVAGCIAGVVISMRLWLSIVQKAALLGLSATMGLASLLLFTIPDMRAQPSTALPILGVALLSIPLLWFNMTIRVARVLDYRRLADQAEDRDDDETAQRYRNLADVIALSVGRVTELRQAAVDPSPEDRA